jgi:hypothetical protein
MIAIQDPWGLIAQIAVAFTDYARIAGKGS